jgi:hypothetical protein
MFNKPKNILALTLLLIIVAPVLLFTVFLVKQKHIQNQMNERLEYASLHTITADSKEVRWIKKDKEAEVQGRLFDVKNFYTDGNTIVLTGLYDDDERELKQKLSLLMKQKKDGTAPLSQLMLKFIFNPALNKITDSNSTVVYISSTKIFFKFYNENVQAQYLSVATPPPNI